MADLVAGQTIGNWTALRRVGLRGGRLIWLCRCVCGTEKTLRAHRVARGETRSCGCQTNVAHGHSRIGRTTPEYFVWSAMLKRCRNPREHSFENYGGRGITVCERWLKFENFLADMGPRPAGHQIDRIDNDGNYEPGNCRWATATEQALNRRPRRRFSRGTIERLPSGNYRARLYANPWTSGFNSEAEARRFLDTQIATRDAQRGAPNA